MNPPRLRLRKDLAGAVARGHPWIYRDALHPQAALVTGTTVDVVDPDGAFVGRGLYDARSPIAVRVATRDPDEALDEDFVGRRIDESLQLRRGLFDPAVTNAWRLVNGEGDFLPGVVADLYADVVVLRLDGDAVRVWAGWVARALVRATGVARVYERERGARGRALLGPAPVAPVAIREHGVHYRVDILRGQKTGFFLDQREGRLALRHFAAGTHTLNLFGYTGGFSVNAALGGARRVTTVDSAAPAIAAARETFVLNGLDPERHDFDCADAFAWLARAATEARRFGLVIVDPPSFAPSEKTRGPALEKYRQLNTLALAVLEPEGVFATASCSSHVGAEDFLDALAEAGRRARRRLRVLEVRGQPADHPSLPAFPEGRYLKLVVARGDGESR